MPRFLCVGLAVMILGVAASAQAALITFNNFTQSGSEAVDYLVTVDDTTNVGQARG